MKNLREKLLELYLICFPEDSLAYAEFFIDNKFDGTNCMTLFDGDKLINMLFLVKKQICVRGTVFDIPYMVAGGTHPDYRGRGIFTKVLLEAMQNFQNAGSRPLTGLMPSAHAFYLRQNYVTHSFVECRPFASGTLPLKEISFGDIPAMKKVYDKFTEGKSGWFVRGQADFDLRLREIFLEGGKAYGMFDGGELKGYALSFDGESIDEYVAEDMPLIEKYDTPFEEYPVHTNAGGGDEENMIRICDNVALLESICYDKKLNESITIEVADPFHKTNSGIYLLTVKNGKGKVEKTQAAEFKLTIEEFTRLVMGCYVSGDFGGKLQRIFPVVTNCPVEKF